MLEAARDLHTRFSELLEQVVKGGQAPTLSIGIAVNHYREPLVDVLTRARQALDYAKNRIATVWLSACIKDPEEICSFASAGTKIQTNDSKPG